MAPPPKNPRPHDLLFEQIVRALLPSFQPAPLSVGVGGMVWQAPSGLRAVWETTRDPVFATTTVVLRVLPPGQSVELVAKHSLSDLVVVNAQSEQNIAILLAESVKVCCGLLAPHLYEHDPRKGGRVLVMHADLPVNLPVKLPVNLLFDPVGHSPPPLVASTPCTVCGRNFQGHTYAVWGGGNLGFLHAQCCGFVGVLLHPP
jgi:hypothetical protein